MNFDRFFDTIEKRRCAYFILVASMFILAAIQTLILGSALFQIQSYQQLFDIVKTDILSISYVSRCIYSMISVAGLTPLEGLLIVVQSLRFFEVSLCILLLVFLISHTSKGYKRCIGISILTFIMVLIGCVFSVMNGIKANSIQIVMDQLQWIGTLFIMQGGFQIIYFLVGIYRCLLHDYLPAMHLEVRYIEDEK